LSAILARDEIRALEHSHASAVPTLMERAGRAIAEAARGMAGESGRPILLLAGPGNNGGDAWVAAAHLIESFHKVVVLDVSGRIPKATEAQAARAGIAARGAGTIVREWPEGLQPALVIDGLLGIGLERDVDAALAAVIDRANHCGAPVLAIDVPSGIDADTGAVHGAGIRATRTLTFIARKPGLLTGEGRGLAGEVVVDELGTGGGRAEARGALLTPETVRGWLAPRDASAHKGSFGTLAVIGGNRGMVGAALLAARAGVLAGAGKVRAGLLAADAPPVDPQFPEIMVASIDDALRGDVLVLGPGAGQSPSATSISGFERSVLPAAFALARPLLLDADALNAVAFNAALETALAARDQAATLLTPHPAEAARMLHRTTAQVQDDRVGSALALARRFNAHVVLKGAGSVLAFPDGRWMINSTGNPGMASGGMGDVLAGLVGALLCQGLPADRALAYGVCLHGAAADSLVARGIGPIGLTASEVAWECRVLLNRWTHS
jgi:hydroxyethylthiazole kinase-like uncharacterized protein yjeF